jgi:flagellar biosynthesis protein FlhG
MHYLDARATTAGFLQALAHAAPQADVVLLHAGAADLRRLFAGLAPRPVLLVGDRPDSLTEAYGAMKLLSQRLGALSYDVVIAAQVSLRRARQISERLAECADHFLGAAVGHCAVVDPAGAARAAAGDDLHRLAAAHLQRSPAAVPLAAPRSAAAAAAVRQGDTGRLN